MHSSDLGLLLVYAWVWLDRMQRLQEMVLPQHPGWRRGRLYHTQGRLRG